MVGLRSLPEQIGNLRRLTNLYVSGNRLTELPDSIGNLTQLTRLDLRDNQLTALPRGLYRLPDTTHIGIENNPIARNFDALRQLAQATNAWERAGQPDENRSDAAQRIFEALCTNSTTLDLSGLGLRSLPGQIGNLTWLTELRVNDNRLTALSRDISHLPSTANIYLNANPLSRETIVELCRQTGGPRIQCERLTHFRQQRERISRWGKNGLPGENRAEAARRMLECFDNNAPELDLPGLGLRSLPEEIGNLVRLEQLTAEDNALTALADGIGNLTRLTGLNLAYNRLEGLPEAIGGLARLTDLRVENNHLSALPESVGNLRALTHFDLRNNRLSALPEAIGNLESLMILRLHNNRFESAPQVLFRLPGAARRGSIFRAIRYRHRPLLRWPNKTERR